MLISEDDYAMLHPSNQQYQIHPGMSKAEQRKSNKPIMEKRRRARINHCLNELKSLILDALKKDPARHSKLEKADILEMTVKHLQTIQQQQLTIAMATDPTVIQKFKTGFNECATEVSRYIGRMDGIEPCVKQRLVSHLASCVSGLKKMPTFSTPTSATQSLFNFNTASPNTVPEDVNNNHASARLQMMTGLQLIPSRLPTGELALLLPNPQQIPGNVMSFFPPSQESNLVTTTSEPQVNTLTGKSVDRHHFSAFTAVHRDKNLLRSPLPSPSSSSPSPSTYCDDSADQPYPSPNNMQEVTSTSEHDRTHSDNIIKVKPVETLLSTERYQNESLKIFPEFPSNPAPKNFHTPLTVITSDRSKVSKYTDVRFHHPANINKNPIDFSIKKEVPSLLSGVKRPFPEDTSSLLMKSDNPIKVMKFSMDEDRSSDPNLAESSRPSTSTSNSDTSRDMWRPW